MESCEFDALIVFFFLKAADVFESLANPLMKLVGLKTLEMTEEGKTSTVVFDYTDFYSNVHFRPTHVLCYLHVFKQYLKYCLCIFGCSTLCFGSGDRTARETRMELEGR